MAPKLSVIVPTYRQADKLAICLNALLNQTLEPNAYEVIVVDDGSGDNTASITDRYAFAPARVRLIEHSVNQGQATARNTGASIAEGDLILFLDGDLRASENYLKTHVNMHESCPNEKLVVVGDIFYNRESMANSNFARFMNSRYLGQRSEKVTRRIDFNNLPAAFCGSGLISLSRATFRNVGGFDQKFRAYGLEDLEFAIRVLASGARAVFARGAHVEHFDNADAVRIRTKHTVMGRETVKSWKKSDRQYLDSSIYRYLTPFEFGDRPVVVTVAKALIQLVLNKPIRLLISAWCLKTDTVAMLYFPPIYLLALVIWFIDGTRSEISR
jgi:GT2 family glycosyltransferase